MPWVVVVLNTLAWLGTTGPGMVSVEPSAFLVDAGMTTNPTSSVASGTMVPILAVLAVVGLIPLYFFYRTPHASKRS